MTPEQQRTMASYRFLAQTRNQTNGRNDFWKPEFEEFRKFIPDQARILDLGCGAGRDARLIAEYSSYRYAGVDLSPEMLAAAKTLSPNCSFALMDMCQLGFPDGCFDAIWAAASLLHLPKDYVSTVLRDLFWLLRHEGRLFVVMREGEGEQMVKQSEHDERFFAFYQLAEFWHILEDVGFEDISGQRVERAGYKYLCYNACAG